jgi:hypothetical protein
MKAKVSVAAKLADVRLVLLAPAGQRIKRKHYEKAEKDFLLARLSFQDHGQARAGPRAPHHRDDNVSRDGHAVLAGADGDGTGRVGVMVSVVGLCSSC